MRCQSNGTVCEVKWLILDLTFLQILKYAPNTRSNQFPAIFMMLNGSVTFTGGK